ncbi:hypothetical protein [Haloarchaeobius amylolyticus]|uniref:hypothetical protein n=1 Tax=Haloarchaeobius amylolyticus TaxID=1198296 RepID=UPI002271EECA|nr:hypothetical protein [Haloarchaeobius amylolyticus]
MGTDTAAPPASTTDLRAASRVRLAFGIIVVGFGVFVATMPALAGSIVRLWLGVVLVGAGIAMVADAKVADSLRAGLTGVAEAMGYLLVGLALLLVPLGQTRLATLFAILYGATGLLRLATAVATPVPPRREAVLSGAALLVVATLLVADLPGRAVWALGLLCGAGLVVVGLSMTVGALRGSPAPDQSEQSVIEEQV